MDSEMSMHISSLQTAIQHLDERMVALEKWKREIEAMSREVEERLEQELGGFEFDDSRPHYFG